MEITLYTTHCPKCKVIESKLEKKGVKYVTIDNVDEVTKIGEINNIQSAPILKVDDTVYAFKEANAFINSL